MLTAIKGAHHLLAGQAGLHRLDLAEIVPNDLLLGHGLELELALLAQREGVRERRQALLLHI